MKRLRWMLWQILMLIEDCLLLRMAVLLLVFSLVWPMVRLVRFFVRRKRGDWSSEWRTLLFIPRDGVRTFALYARLGWAQHRVRIGEV